MVEEAYAATKDKKLKQKVKGKGRAKQKSKPGTTTATVESQELRERAEGRTLLEDQQEVVQTDPEAGRLLAAQELMEDYPASYKKRVHDWLQVPQQLREELRRLHSTSGTSRSQACCGGLDVHMQDQRSLQQPSS